MTSNPVIHTSNNQKETPPGRNTDTLRMPTSESVSVFLQPAADPGLTVDLHARLRSSGDLVFHREDDDTSPLYNVGPAGGRIPWL